MQKLWPKQFSAKICQKPAYFGLISDWTSRNRGQPDLDADLTFFFFAIFFFFALREDGSDANSLDGSTKIRSRLSLWGETK